MVEYNLNLQEVSRKYSKSIDMANLNRGITWKMDSAVKHKHLAERYVPTKIRENCPICGELEHEIFVNIYGYDYVECKNCGHIYLNTLIEENDIKTLYLGAENKNLQHMVYLDEELFSKRVKQVADPKVSWVAEMTNRNGLWIDIGCGTGEILFSAMRKGYKVKGIDADIKEIEFAQSKGINVVCDYVTDANANEYINEGNIISLFNILEHLENPIELLKNISNNIEEGTYIVIEVPRHPSISSLNNLIFSEIACRHIYPPDHMHIFTEKSLDIMLQEANLELTNIWLFGQDAYDFIITALASKGIKKNAVIDKVLESIPILQKSIDESGLSDTMIVICRK